MPNLDSPFVHDRNADSPSEHLADRIRAACADRSNGAERTVQVQVPVTDNANLLEWLRGRENEEQVFWAPRSPETTSFSPSGNGHSEAKTSASRPAVAATGTADVLTGTRQPMEYDRLQRALNDRFRTAAAPVRYYGGLRFDAPQSRTTENPECPWRPFGTYRFVLPRFELRRAPDGVSLACNLVFPRDAGRAETLIEQARVLSIPTREASPSLPKPLGRTDAPEKEEWTRMVQWALSAISDHALDKVVLARKVALELERTLTPLDVLQHLKAATPGCFHFALSPAGGPAFLGASPERLFRQEGRQVVSEAVAGTGERGDTPSADAALWEELLNSPKERREHAFVQNAIRNVLDRLCSSVEVPDTPSELRLARGRHLHARLSGRLRAEVATTDLLDRLHPTPAVGGVPTDQALTAIRTQEPFDRGWYAGPVGWVGPEAAEFAVAIRSGLAEEEKLTLYSGAGIVEGSVPAREWEEIEQKIGDFAAVMGLGARVKDPSR
ncbi:hypothetical protein BSZ35_02610 [Salinibacter sp. 10B]|uniref:isochorismate synthase n=1 Tax=Salinibacter sp. 10B TaxID=1923971 RepID=UPI000CF3ACE4|nr:isochorismate synthase [Salinibacter sp. 10B]PQJ33637.1 hypothetical protein BSZ35_02610 [Salinibacter sp. 10B]